VVGQSRPRVLVIGVDCADPSLIRQWINRGLLPNLAHLDAKGVMGELESTPTFLSPEAWTGFQCGVNAGKHGIFEFQQRVDDGYGARPVNARDRQCRTIWSLLSDAGRRVAVTNIPLTFPAEPLNGIQISGFKMRHGSSSTYVNWPSVNLGGSFCVLEDCEVRHVGAHGIWFERGCRHNRIERCHVYDAGAGGVYIGWTQVEPESSHNVVHNCFIHHLTEVHGAPSASGSGRVRTIRSRATRSRT